MFYVKVTNMIVHSIILIFLKFFHLCNVYNSNIVYIISRIRQVCVLYQYLSGQWAMTSFVLGTLIFVCVCYSCRRFGRVFKQVLMTQC